MILRNSMKFLFLVQIVFLFECFSQVSAQNDAVIPDHNKVFVWVNKCNIILTGKKPSSEKTESTVLNFQSTGFNSETREKYLREVQHSEAWAENKVREIRRALIETTSTTEIREKAREFNRLLADSTLALFHDLIHTDQWKMIRLDSAVRFLLAHPDRLNEVEKNFSDNWFYDQINMGADNFVISVYAHFLNRFPTKFELTQGKNMVSGHPAILFFKNGKCKDDFLSIFFQSDEYLQNQIINIYQKIFFRNPSNLELVNNLNRFKAEPSIAVLERTLLASEEFVNPGRNNE